MNYNNQLKELILFFHKYIDINICIDSIFFIASINDY